MALYRHLAIATLAAVLSAAGAGAVLADPPPWSNTERPRVPGIVIRSHALVSGRVAAVDYGHATILVATPHGAVPIRITPSTNIFRGRAFASLSDIRLGSKVEVNVSDFGGWLVAQIIRIH